MANLGRLKESGRSRCTSIFLAALGSWPEGAGPGLSSSRQAGPGSRMLAPPRVPHRLKQFHLLTTRLRPRNYFWEVRGDPVATHAMTRCPSCSPTHGPDPLPLLPDPETQVPGALGRTSQPSTALGTWLPSGWRFPVPSRALGCPASPLPEEWLQASRGREVPMGEQCVSQEGGWRAAPGPLTMLPVFSTSGPL